MQKIINTIKEAIVHKTQLKISSVNENKQTNVIDMSAFNQVITYYPEELVITVEAGIKVSDLRLVLASYRQALGFETTHCCSIGAAFALGDNNLRDFVLGVKIIDGRGDVLNFGGQAMKNVAGYDVSRLLVGSGGKLAVISEISFKVLPENYLHKTKPIKPVKPQNNALRSRIEQGLKQVFDPYNIFI